MTRSISNKRSNDSQFSPQFYCANLKVETQNLASPVLPIPTYARENTQANKRILASPVLPTPTYTRENTPANKRILASPVLPIPTYARENTQENKRILASPVHPTPTYARENMLTTSANLLVRRKILRLYFDLQHISSCRIQFVNGKQRDYCIHEQHYHIYGNNLKKHQKSRSKSTENTLKRHP